MSAKPQIIRVNPDTPSFLDRYEDVKIARGRLLAHQRVKIPPNELLAVKQAVKARRRRRRRGKNLRGEVKEIKTQQRRFEKGERRDRDEEEPRIVGDPKPGLNFDPELEKEKERNRAREAMDSFALEARRVRLEGRRLALDERTQDARERETGMLMLRDDANREANLERERAALAEDARRFDIEQERLQADRREAALQAQEANEREARRIDFEREKLAREQAVQEQQIQADLEKRSLEVDEEQRERLSQAAERAAEREATLQAQERQIGGIREAFDTAQARSIKAQEDAFADLRLERQREANRFEQVLENQSQSLDALLGFVRSASEREALQREAQIQAQPNINVYYGSDPNAQPDPTHRSRTRSLSPARPLRPDRPPQTDVGTDPPDPERFGLAPFTGGFYAGTTGRGAAEGAEETVLRRVESIADRRQEPRVEPEPQPQPEPRLEPEPQPDTTPPPSPTVQPRILRGDPEPTRRFPIEQFATEEQIEAAIGSPEGSPVGRGGGGGAALRTDPEPTTVTETLGRAARAVIDPTIVAGRGLVEELFQGEGGGGGGGLARVPVRPGEQTGGLGAVRFDPETGEAVAEGIFGGGETPEGFVPVGGGVTVGGPPRGFQQGESEGARRARLRLEIAEAQRTTGGIEGSAAQQFAARAVATAFPPSRRDDRVAPPAARDFSYGPVTTSLMGRIANATRELQGVEQQIRDARRLAGAKTKGPKFKEKQNIQELEVKATVLRRQIAAQKEQLEERGKPFGRNPFG